MNKKKVIKCAFCLKEQKEEEGNHHKVQEEETNLNGNEEEEEEEEENEDEENGHKQKKKKEPVMITNVPKKRRTKYGNTSSLPSYYNFSNCPHVICIKCIARILFTSNLNILPASSSLSFSCNCNQGSLSLDINTIMSISHKVNEPDSERLCEKHGLILYQYCLDCKKNLCKKCDESHSDLFNNHHIVKEEPPNTSTCEYHPNCFLDRLCKDCKCQICHLCIVEGNKHFCHNTISFDNLKSKIIANVGNMKSDNFEDFEKELNQYNEKYNKLFNEEVNLFNNQIEELIAKINQYKDDFNANMNVKMEEKNNVIEIVSNLYKFFYSEYAKVPNSVDYPVLCMYQVLNSEFMSFSFSTPDTSSTYLSNIMNDIAEIEISPLYKTKYQFSLKNFTSKKKLSTHSGTINSLCCTNDGRLVSAAEDKTVIIWDRELLKPFFTIKDATSVKVVKILSDNRLITGGFKEMKIYNDKYKCVNVLKETSNNVVDLIQLDDGRIISGSYREMRIFSVNWNNTYKDSKPVKDHSSWVKCLLKLKNKLFATAGDDMKIFIYDYTIKCVRTISFESEIHSLCLMNDNDINDLLNSFYIGDNKGRIFNYNYVNNKYEMVSDIDQHHNKVNTIIRLRGGNYASCSSDGNVIIRDGFFSPIQYLNQNGTKAINSIVQNYNGIVIYGGDDCVLSLFE